MNLQDSIFDVRSKLEGTAEVDDFDRIITYLGNLERKVEDYEKVFFGMEDVVYRRADLPAQKDTGSLEEVKRQIVHAKAELARLNMAELGTLGNLSLIYKTQEHLTQALDKIGRENG